MEIKTHTGEQASLLERIEQTKRPDLVVMMGYGDELPVFRRARALWEFYATHFPGIELVFPRWSNKLKRGEVVSEGRDLLVGIGDGFQGDAGYSNSGVWSQSENARWIYRQVLAQDYVLRNREGPFFLYQTTVTSVVDFRGLCTVLDQLDPVNCYAGPLARLNGPEAFNGLTFVSGASVVLSRDVLERMRERYDPRHVFATLPNDIWQAALLHDVARQALPTFNLVKPRAARADAGYITALVKQQLQQGQYHFRVKTVAPEDAAGRREDIDPWIMLRTMEAILESEHTPAATLALVDKVRRMTGGGAGAPVAPIRAEPLHTGHRDFPLSDLEIA